MPATCTMDHIPNASLFRGCSSVHPRSSVKQLEASGGVSLPYASWELNSGQLAAVLAKVDELKAVKGNLVEEKIAIGKKLKQYVFEVVNNSLLAIPENAPLSEGDSAHVRLSLIEYFPVKRRNVQSNDTAGHQSVNEANHLELSALDAANTHPVAEVSDGTSDMASGGIDNVAPPTSVSVDDPSDNDGNGNNGGVGDKGSDGDGPSQDITIGVLFLFMVMVAEFVPSLMQVPGSTPNHSLNQLLLAINLAAAGCFFSSSCGLLGVVVGMLDCHLFSCSTLQKVQKISFIAAVTFLMVAMTMVCVFILAAMMV